MLFDPWLYVALGLGLVVGRLSPRPSAWSGPAALATVGALVFLIGVDLGEVRGLDPLRAVPGAIVLAALLVLFTLAAVVLLRGGRPPPARSVALTAPRAIWTGPVLLVVMGVGLGLGRWVTVSVAWTIDPVLALLLFFVGLGVVPSWTALRAAWVPIVGAVAGATVAGLLFAALAHWTPGLGLAASYAFGWYSLVGPLMTTRAGALVGLTAFLANFFRENLTMVCAPLLGPSVGGEGIAAVGGATSLDTTLYFSTRFGGRSGGTLGLATGLVLTLAAAVVVPALLSLPPP